MTYINSYFSQKSSEEENKSQTNLYNYSSEKNNQYSTRPNNSSLNPENITESPEKNQTPSLIRLQKCQKVEPKQNNQNESEHKKEESNDIIFPEEKIDQRDFVYEQDGYESPSSKLEPDNYIKIIKKPSEILSNNNQPQENNDEDTMVQEDFSNIENNHNKNLTLNEDVDENFDTLRDYDYENNQMCDGFDFRYFGETNYPNNSNYG